MSKVIMEQDVEDTYSMVKNATEHIQECFVCNTAVFPGFELMWVPSDYMDSKPGQVEPMCYDCADSAGYIPHTQAQIVNAEASKIGRACIRAKHSLVWNEWTESNDPEICDECDEKIGVLVP